jgi:nuclear RNA export factor
MQSKVDGNTIIISVPSEDAHAIASTDGYQFAGTTLKVTSTFTGPRGKSPPKSSFSFRGGASTEKLKEALKVLLSRRYDAATKILNLSDLSQEPEIKEMNVRDLNAHPNLFQVFMKLCDEAFPTVQSKTDMVDGILLGSNNLIRVNVFRSLAMGFPNLKNLDLSNNKFKLLKDITGLSREFRHLEHIILSNNAIEQEVPSLKKELIRWFQKLQLINGVQLSPAEIEAARNQKVPLAVKTGHIEGETSSIAAEFIKNFFTGYDTDRKALVNYYYDATSTFSLSVNTHALRDPSSASSTQKQEWDAYIRLSRNLLRINHLSARMNRTHKGGEAITKLFESLPATQHPGLEHAAKWLIESRTQPGIPDPTGQSPTGVNGLCVTIHGEFEETGTNFNKKQRSFDRTFVLGPGGVSGVKIVSDMLVLRAYGGTQAFVPEEVPMTVEDERLAMVSELSRQTGMNLQYAVMCLEQNGGSLEAALANFAEIRSMIPPEAFVQ